MLPQINKRIVLLIGILILSINSIIAKDGIPEPMYPFRLVNDFAHLFTQSELDNLENKLQDFHNNTSNQIYVVTVESLDGDSPYNYATRLGNKWQIGQKDKDNGVLILIKPKKKSERGEIFIAPGYGLEGTLNDAFVGRVIDEYMIPYLKQNNYFMATDQAIDVLIARINGDTSLANEPLPNRDDEPSLIDQIIVASFIIIFIFCLIRFPRFRTFMLMLLVLGSRGNNGGGNGNSGSSGRGFGGGGGGRFGGGGAGRSW